MLAPLSLFRLKLPGFADLTGAILLLGLLVSSGPIAGDPGIGWHLKAGELMAERGAVLRSDPFLFTSGGREWIDNQWFSELVFAKLYQLGGWPLLHVFVLGIVLTIYVGVLYPLLLSVRNAPFAVFFVTLLAALNGAIQWILRPVLLSVLLFALVYRVLYQWYFRIRADNGRLDSKELFCLPLLFLLWANLHPAFVLGLLLICFCFLSVLVDRSIKAELRNGAMKKLGVVILFSALMTFINPYGLSLYRNIFALMGDEYFMNLNAEWLSPNFRLLFYGPFLLAIVLAAALLARLREKPLTPFDWLLVVTFLYLGLVSRRYIPFFGIVSSVPLVKLISDYSLELELRDESLVSRLKSAAARVARFEKKASAGNYALLIFLAVFSFTLYSGHLPRHSAEFSAPDYRFPKKAVDILAMEPVGGRIFHTPDFGGYITWRLWPGWQPFIDDRNELNGRKVYEDFFLLNGAKAGWRDVFAGYDFTWALLENRSRLGLLLEDNGAWKKIYRDDSVSLYQKNLPNSGSDS